MSNLLAFFLVKSGIAGLVFSAVTFVGRLLDLPPTPYVPSFPQCWLLTHPSFRRPRPPITRLLNPQTTPIHSLPPELLLHILSLAAVDSRPFRGTFFPATFTLRSATLVCRNWRSAAQGLLWEDVLLSTAPHTRAFVAATEARGLRTERLRLQPQSVTEEDRRTIDGEGRFEVEKVLRACMGLRRIELSNVMDLGLDAFAGLNLQGSLSLRSSSSFTRTDPTGSRPALPDHRRPNHFRSHSARLSPPHPSLPPLPPHPSPSSAARKLQPDPFPPPTPPPIINHFSRPLHLRIRRPPNCPRSSRRNPRPAPHCAHRRTAHRPQHPKQARLRSSPPKLRKIGAPRRRHLR